MQRLFQEPYVGIAFWLIVIATLVVGCWAYAIYHFTVQTLRKYADKRRETDGPVSR